MHFYKGRLSLMNGMNQPVRCKTCNRKLNFYLYGVLGMRLYLSVFYICTDCSVYSQITS